MPDPNPIDHRLDALARDLAEEFVLAGPLDARHRGERRRARRRVAGAAVSVAVIGALVAGAWQFAPWRPAGEGSTPMASAGERGGYGARGGNFGGDDDAPMPPAALLWDDRLAWRFADPVAESVEQLRDPELFCGLPSAPRSVSPTTRSVRYYEGSDGAVASYELLEFASRDEAVRAQEELWQSTAADRDGEGGTTNVTPPPGCDSWLRYVPTVEDAGTETENREKAGEETGAETGAGTGAGTEADAGGYQHLPQSDGADPPPLWTWHYLARDATKVAVLRVIATVELPSPPDKPWYGADQVESPYSPSVACIDELLRDARLAEGQSTCATATAERGGTPSGSATAGQGGGR